MGRNLLDNWPEVFGTGKAPPEASPGAEAVREHLNRVLAAQTFGQSDRLRRLLRFLVEQTLDGNSNPLKEYTLGIEVFDRTANFDPRIDSTVRVHAGKLRDKLREYYLTEGCNETVRIELPRGRYVPVFQKLDTGVHPLPVLVDESQPEPSRLPPRSPIRGWIPYLAAAVATVSAIVTPWIYYPRQQSEGAAIRFTVSSPEGSIRFGPGQISPDGRHLAFTVRDNSGARIWLRPFGATSGYLLPGTEGGIPQAWSPDGRFLFFLTDQQIIKKLEIGSTRPPETVANVSRTSTTTIWGLDANAEGIILLGQDGKGIHGVSKGGREPRPVTNLDSARREVGHYWPSFLPDGRHFLYFARSGNPALNAVYVASLDGKTRKHLFNSTSYATYAALPPPARSRSGYLLYSRNHALFAQPFDSATLEISGQPVQIIDRVGQGQYGTAAFRVSATGILIYVADQPLRQFTWYDRSGTRLGTIGPPGFYGGFALSCDGKRMALAAGEGSDQDIWTMDLSSGQMLRLTWDPETDHFPVWSPDDKWIVFDSHRSNSADLYLKDSSGAAGEELLLKLTGPGAVSDWSSDGRFIAFSDFTPKTKYDVWISPREGVRKPFPFLATEADEGTARFSPDGKWIAYDSDETGKSEVYVRSFTGLPAKPNEGKWQVSTHGGSDPAWRRDGKELFYVAADNSVMAVSIEAGTTFHTGIQTLLFQVPPAALRFKRFAVSGDGQHFLLNLAANESGPHPINVFVNWFTALKR